MAVDTPAAADATPVADAADASLLEDAAPAADDKAAPAEGDKPVTEESKPEGDKPSGDDGAKAKDDESEASLLADDDEGKSAEDKDGQADKSKDGAPETYEAFTFPDGVEVDEAQLAKATPVFKEFGLNQEQAQKLVSLHAEVASAAVETVLSEQRSGFNTLVKEWTAQTKAHPEFGGDKLAESRGLVKKAIGALSGSPEEAAELTSMLNEWKLANNPHLFALLARAGSKLSEDTLITGDAAAQARAKSVAQRMFPNMPGDNQ